ncbi:unnamed protein product [Closterium sp. NIES-54]
MVPRLALVAGTLHTCSTTSATATASTASSSPSSYSSTLLALSRGPSIRELVSIAPHMSALVTIVALAFELATTASVALVVAAVSATPAASIEFVAAKSASPSSFAPSIAITLADACCYPHSPTHGSGSPLEGSLASRLQARGGASHG